MPNLLAVSDLHVGFAENARIVEGIRPEEPGDWLIVAGDVAERFSQVVSTLRSLRERFEKVIWVPGNHELWTLSDDPVTARGASRYDLFVDALRAIDVVTPEDPYPIWDYESGPLVVAPLFVLYDYTFRPDGASSKKEALEIAERANILCSDEVLLHPDPFASREAWAATRLEITRARLDALPADARTVLVNHFPLVREPTARLWYPEFALWCGSVHTADWPKRYGAEAVVFGHLHIPVTTVVDGIPHYEVSLGYPREWGDARAPRRRIVRVPSGDALELLR